jgi:hypothetical protein
MPIEPNLGTSSAKQETFKECNTRKLGLRVYADNPDCADVEQLRDLTIVEMKKDFLERNGLESIADWGYAGTAIEYTANREAQNCFRDTAETEAAKEAARQAARDKKAAAQAAAQAEKEKKAAASKGKVKDHIKKEAIILLDLQMANGKPLGECTKADLQKASGWQSKIAAKLTGRQKVKDVFSEKEVRSLYKS